MQISELIKLGKWYEEECKDSGLIDDYNMLTNKIQQNVNNQRVPFEEEKEALISNLSNMSFGTLTLEQMAFLETLGIRDYLGSNGIKTVKDILYKNHIDIASVLQHFRDIVKAFSEATGLFDNIESSLSKFLPDDDPQVLPDETLMRIYFKEGSSINTIVDFKKLATQWHDISRGIALAVDHKPEDVRIISAEKGSIIVNAAVLTVIADVVSRIVLRALEIADKVLDLKVKKIEIEKMQLEKNEKETIVDSMKGAIEGEKKRGAESICETIIEECNIIDSEKKQGLRKSVEKMIAFIEKGGNVDFICKDNNEVDDADEENEQQNLLRDNNAKLIETVQKIREIEGHILLLEEKMEH